VKKIQGYQSKMVDRFEENGRRVSAFALSTMGMIYICLSLFKFTDFKSHPTIFLILWFIQIVFQFSYVVAFCTNCEFDGVCSHVFMILMYMLCCISESILLYADIDSHAEDILMQILSSCWWFFTILVGCIVALILFRICACVYVYCILPCRQAMIGCFDYVRDRRQLNRERQAIRFFLKDVGYHSTNNVAMV
jgi:hypothetical protein